jgi:hypothetical protein
MFDFFGNQSPDVLNESLWSLLFCSADSSEHAGIIHAKDESSAAEKIVDKGPKSPVWSYSKDMSGFSPSCVSMMSRSFVVEPLECGGLCEEGEYITLEGHSHRPHYTFFAQCHAPLKKQSVFCTSVKIVKDPILSSLCFRPLRLFVPDLALLRPA